MDGEAAERPELLGWWFGDENPAIPKHQTTGEPLTPDMDFWRLVLVEFLSWGPISMNGIMITMEVIGFLTGMAQPQVDHIFCSKPWGL